jgi:hypothetical protein
MRGFLIIYTVRSTGKDNAFVVILFYFFGRNFVVGLDFGIHLLRTNTPCDELVILTAKIQNKNLIHCVTSFLTS